MPPDDFRFEELEEAISICQRHDPYDLCMMIGGFYIFNDEVLGYVPSHLAVNFAFVNSSAHSGKKTADVRTTLRFLELLKGAYDKVVPPFAEPFATYKPRTSSSPEKVRASLNEMAIVRAGISNIRNPGSVGQMANYALDKYYPVDDILRRALGFGSVEAFRTIRMLQKKTERRFSEELSEQTIAKIRALRSQPRKAMRIPPKEFLILYRNASTMTPEDLGQNEKLFRGPLKKLVQFLSISLDDARNHGGFLHRWCFLRQDDGVYLLPLPIYMMETLVSAIQVGILAGLSEQERSKYGSKMGSIFEDIVADRFHHYLTESKVTPRYRVGASTHSQNTPDVDVLVEMPDGGVLLVLCRAKGLKYRTKWGNRDNFERDFRKNLHDQADQIAKILSASPELLSRTRACFVVTEASFPGISGFIRSESSLGTAFKGLPNPFVLSLYDLELVMSYVRAERFSDYLNWHSKALDTKELLVTDETDFVAIYHREGSNPDFFNKVRFKPTFSYVDDYSDFSMKTLTAVDTRLGIPPGPY